MGTNCDQWEETISFLGAMDTNWEEEREGIKGNTRDPGQEIQGRRLDLGPLGRTKKTAKLLYFNARSILSKLDLLQTHAYENKPDIIAICESFTNVDIGDALLGVEGYEKKRWKRYDQRESQGPFHIC